MIPRVGLLLSTTRVRSWLPMAAAFLLSALTLAPQAEAIPAPHLVWNTIDSDWCTIHFHEETEVQARKVAAYCDVAVHYNASILASYPTEKIEIIVSDATDFENGFAITVPYNRVNLFTVGPSSASQLGYTSDSLELLVIHEIFHIVHLEISSGIPAFFNRVFGKFWPPNQIVPTWLVEGMAVYAETKLTSGGRIRSPLLDARLRLSALEGDLWEFDDLTNVSRRTPGGTGAYLYGGRFLAELVAHHGEEIFAKFAHAYGGTPIPYAIERTWKTTTGIDLSREYAAFLASLRQDAERLKAKVAARGGPSKRRRLTRLGREISRPRFVGEELWVAAAPLVGRSGLFSLGDIRQQAPTPNALARLHSVADFVPLDDKRALIGMPDRYRNNFTYYDLAIVDQNGPIRWVTRGKRLQEPDLFPDGKRAVAVERTGAGSALVVVDVATGETEDLVRYRGANWAYTPMVSPDGSTVAYSLLQRGGAREIMLVDVATKEVTRLTNDGVEDRDPTFTPDGTALVFSSAREGVFNLFRFDLESSVVTRITDTLGAATLPTVTPDGKAVIYADMTLDGIELFAAPMPPPSEQKRAPSAGPALAEPPPATLSTQEARAYNPFSTLLPRVWAPVVAADALGGLAVGVDLRGNDAIDSHEWNLNATWGFGQMRPRVAGTWRMKDLFFPVTFNGSYVTTESDAERRNAGQPELQRETQLRASADISMPVARWWQNHSFAFGYSRTFSFVETPLTATPDDPAPRYPPPTNIGALTFRWSYSSNERYRDSVSTEDGESFTLRLRMANEWTLSPLDLYEATFDFRLYRRVPGLTNHVIAVLPEIGWAQGDRRRRANYRLGGFATRDLVSDVINNGRSNSGFLRGYGVNADVGDAYWLVSTEYRFPLLEVEKGIGLLPLSLTRFTAIAFADFGDAFDGLPRAGATKIGVGAELRAQLRIGYFGVVVVRAGYARGMTTGGQHQPYLLLGSPY